MTVRRLWFLIVALVVAPASAAEPQFVDLSLLVAPEYPCTWAAGFPPFEILHYQKIGPLSAYNSDLLMMDEHTGTQFDAPTHSVTPPDSGLPNAGKFGTMSSEKVPAWQFGGEACVLDVRDMRDSGPKGRSDIVSPEHIARWQSEYRKLRFGDVLLFRSDYTDTFYRPVPEGRRFLAEALEARVSGWPDPGPDCMAALAATGVLAAGTDSPSMGPIPGPISEETHYAGLRHGMIWTESGTNYGKLPVTGAFYCMLAPKVVKGVGASGRAFAIVGDPLASRLIDSARNKRAVDLSVELHEDRPLWWPGRGVGRARYAYFKNLVLPFKQQRHVMDSGCGTHLVPPSFALPATNDVEYSAEVRGWLAEYERKFGPRLTSTVTTEQVPISQTCGRARVVDLKPLVGTTDRTKWPASPEVTPAVLQQYERANGEFQPGDVVLLATGHNDRLLKPFPEGKACIEDPLNGKSEGWPALTAESVEYLHKRGIRAVGIDAPGLGGVDEKQALWTYWALGSRGMAGIEFLQNLAAVPKESYFLFAAMKIRDCHGGPGRAIAFY